MVFPLIPALAVGAAAKNSMGKKSSPAPPPAPNPYEIARADAEFNRIDQFTPFGSLTYGGPNRNQATLEFNPQLQEILNSQMGMDAGLLNTGQQALPGLEGLIQSPLDLQGLPNLPNDVEGYRTGVEDAFYDRSSRLLDEQFQLDEDRLRQTLANQGLQSGGEAFGTEFGLFNQRRGETYENLARDAVLFGGQEASRQLGDQARLRGQLFGERGAVRSNQFNELGSLLGLQQVQQPGLQNFFGPGMTNTVDAFGLQQQSLNNAFNARNQRASSAKGAGAQLAGTLGSAWIGR